MKERARNLTTSQRCDECETPGWVLTRRNPDECAPCPSCEAGARAEIQRYGGDYWQGREPAYYPRYRPEQLLSKMENGLRMKLLNARLAGRDADPLTPAGMPERERLSLLVERVKALTA